MRCCRPCRGAAGRDAARAHRIGQGEGANRRHRRADRGNLVAVYVFTMPAGLALRATVLGAVTGFFPIGWIILNVIFLYRLTVETRRVRDAADDHRPGDGRPPLATPADRLFLRRLLRGRVGLRHPGRGDGRDPDRPRLLAARRFGAVADRQHRPCGLWRARHANCRTCQRNRHRPLHSRRDGRAAIAVLLADRAVLADLGLRRLPGHDAGLARDPGLRRLLRDPAIPDLELSSIRGSSISARR